MVVFINREKNLYVNFDNVECLKKEQITGDDGKPEYILTAMLTSGKTVALESSRNEKDIDSILIDFYMTYDFNFFEINEPL